MYSTLIVGEMELDSVTIMCIAAANYLIDKTNEYNEGKLFRERILMSGKRLQKLLFFSDVLYLTTYGQRMLRDVFYAWPSGPVIPSVYTRFIQYQSGEMRPAKCENNTLSEQERNILDLVFLATISRPTSELIRASHAAGGPWAMAYDQEDKDHRQAICENRMREFYRGMTIEQMISLS